MFKVNVGLIGIMSRYSRFHLGIITMIITIAIIIFHRLNARIITGNVQHTNGETNINSKRKLLLDNIYFCAFK